MESKKIKNEESNILELDKDIINSEIKKKKNIHK